MKTNDIRREEAYIMEEKITLEDMFRELETLTEQMEDPDITLEQSFDLYNRGMELLKKCNESIDSVEKKVLVLDESGETHEF